MSIRSILAVLAIAPLSACAMSSTTEPEGVNESSAAVRTDPCATVRCAAGTHCVAKGGSAACVADPIDPCAAVLCIQGTQCVVKGGKPRCVAADACATVRCASGYVCSAGACVPDLCADPNGCGPALGMPNTLCSDGVTVAGPTGNCLQYPSGCGWEVISCP